MQQVVRWQSGKAAPSTLWPIDSGASTNLRILTLLQHALACCLAHAGLIRVIGIEYCGKWQCDELPKQQQQQQKQHQPRLRLPLMMMTSTTTTTTSRRLMLLLLLLLLMVLIVRQSSVSCTLVKK